MRAAHTVDEGAGRGRLTGCRPQLGPKGPGSGRTSLGSDLVKNSRGSSHLPGARLVLATPVWRGPDKGPQVGSREGVSPGGLASAGPHCRSTLPVYTAGPHCGLHCLPALPTCRAEQYWLLRVGAWLSFPSCVVFDCPAQSTRYAQLGHLDSPRQARGPFVQTQFCRRQRECHPTHLAPHGLPGEVGGHRPDHLKTLFQL